MDLARSPSLDSEQQRALEQQQTLQKSEQISAQQPELNNQLDKHLSNNPQLSTEMTKYTPEQQQNIIHTLSKEILEQSSATPPKIDLVGLTKDGDIYIRFNEFKQITLNPEQITEKNISSHEQKSLSSATQDPELQLIQKKEINDKVAQSIMKSEGASHTQGGRKEVYGFRDGNPGYKEIVAARNKHGLGSEEEFKEVKKFLTKNAESAGALNFTDSSKQAVIMSIAHLRGVGGAQAILNAMDTGEIVKSDKLSQTAIDKIEAMTPEDFQEKLIQVRLDYDKEIYGSTMSTVNGKKDTWWNHYGNGLKNRYDRESTEFLKLKD